VSQKKTLFLLRHGKTGFPGCYIGSRDVPLVPEGIAQIEALQKILQAQSFDKILASPMLRCRQTCEILFPNSTVTYNNNLREVDFGRWEGLTFQQISKQDPEIVNKWVAESLRFTFPEGESVTSFVERIQSVGTELSQAQDEQILVVCHGGVIRALLCHFLGIDHQNYLLFHVKKGNYSTLELFGDQGVLTGLNLH
jgi:alpha-ribazole phosphatase